MAEYANRTGTGSAAPARMNGRLKEEENARLLATTGSWSWIGAAGSGVACPGVGGGGTRHNKKRLLDLTDK